MTLIVDAAPLIAQVERDNPLRELASAVMANEPGALVLSPFVVAEVDYFVQKLGGARANTSLIADLAAGRFEVPHFTVADFSQIERLNSRYRDLSPGIADLSIVVLAARYNTTRVLTFDQRHFRLFRPLHGGTFTLLPFDEPPA